MQDRVRGVGHRRETRIPQIGDEDHAEGDPDEKVRRENRADYRQGEVPCGADAFLGKVDVIG